MTVVHTSRQEVFDMFIAFVLSYQVVEVITVMKA